MEQTEDTVTPTSVIAGRVRALRRRHGWTADQLAEQMTAAGSPWTRVVVTKLETGRRPSVSVDELLALAYVLDVAPVHLLVPPVDGDEDELRIAVVSGMAVPPGAAREWIRGQMPFGKVDTRVYFSEVPPDEFGQGPYGGPAGAIVG